MDIGIIGAGKIGQAAATRLVAAGHRVMLANSRGPQTFGDVVAALGPAARAGNAEEGAAFGDGVLVAVPLAPVEARLPDGALAGRVVIDAKNYYPQRDGRIEELERGDLGSSELLARTVP